MPNKLPFNYANFVALQEEVEELKDLLIKMNAKLSLQEKDTKPAPKKAPATKKTTKKG